MTGPGSVPAGSSPRAMARSTMTAIAASRAAQKSAITPRISADAAAPASTLRVVAAPRGLASVACTDRARARRSAATVPVSGTSIMACAAAARAWLTRSALVRQRR